MALAFESVHAVCAYYENSDKMTITCEGFIPGTVCRQCFGSIDAKKAHFKTYCAQMQCYTRCPTAQMLEQKYLKK